jgi:hypothetical protein
VAVATDETISLCAAHTPCIVCGSQALESGRLCENHAAKYRRLIGLVFRSLPDIGDLLDALAASIRRTTEFMERTSAKRTTGDEWPDDDWFVEEGVLVDDVLGLAFVTCQLFITAVVSVCQRLHRFPAFQTGTAHGEAEPIGILSTDKYRLLKRNSSIVGASGITQVEAMETLANYFKHRDEWPGKWEDLKDTQKRTAESMKLLGLLKDEAGDIVRVGDFRDGFKLLAGRDHYDELRNLKAILDSWRDELVKDEFKALKLTI